MDSYRIEWKRSAAQELKKLPRQAIERIVKAVEQLATEPYPGGVRKLVGAEHTYRIRVGDYRVVYSVTASVLVIEIIRVGHRRDIYHRWPTIHGSGEFRVGESPRLVDVAALGQKRGASYGHHTHRRRQRVRRTTR
jgi:mRNA interferase RelE/StbE